MRPDNDPGEGHLSMATIVLGIFVLAIAEEWITTQFELEKWQASAGLIVLSVGLYFLTITLLKFFVRKRAPEFASTDQVMPDIQPCELTAGHGVVPRWVSWIGLWAISAMIAAALPLAVGAMNLLLR